MVFGAQLRARREAAGLSLADLAGLVHYSKSHLSKIETGDKAASVDLARRCDAALGCAGDLARLARPRTAADPAAAPAAGEPGGDIWTMRLDPDGGGTFGSTSRRAAPGGITALATLVPPRTGHRPASSALDTLRVMFDHARLLGQHTPAALMLPMLATQTHLLRATAAGAAPAERGATWLLASRFAEYAGWMAQESGDDVCASWWTGEAILYAQEGGDQDMAAYACVRRALIALHRSDGLGTVELARRAQETGAGHRVLGLAAQREAQGHALCGDPDSTWRALDRARAHLARVEPDPDAPVLGSQHVGDPVSIATGWCLFDLGRPADAADVLRRELLRIPVSAVRTQSRFGARLALALAGSAAPDEACAAAHTVLDLCTPLDSATIATDLRSLSRALSRWHGRSDVREVRNRLNVALHQPARAA